MQSRCHANMVPCKKRELHGAWEYQIDVWYVWLVLIFFYEIVQFGLWGRKKSRKRGMCIHTRIQTHYYLDKHTRTLTPSPYIHTQIHTCTRKETYSNSTPPHPHTHTQTMTHFLQRLHPGDPGNKNESIATPAHPMIIRNTPIALREMHLDV